MIKTIQIGIATKNFQSSQGKSNITSIKAPSVNSVANPSPIIINNNPLDSLDSLTNNCCQGINSDELRILTILLKRLSSSLTV